MTSLEWIPEAYPPSGGLSAVGFSKLLGRPDLDQLAVLVRETAQNSWDARFGEDTQVEFDLELWDLTKGEISGLRNTFSNAEMALGTGLEAALAAQSMKGLFISDRGTRGLGGPLLADQESSEGTYDWVNFVLNVGKQRLAPQSAGTYGFGKTISYVVSKANAIVIYTRTRVKGRPESRLIACAIGKEFVHARRNCTGRQWWGVSQEGSPTPATGTVADELASRIGMPAFDDREYGTTILVVEPELGNRTDLQAATFLAESITWNLWPKMVKIEGWAPMQFGVSLNGDDIHVAEPHERPPLQAFEQAFRAIVLDQDGTSLPVGGVREEIKSLRPRTAIGDLVIVKTFERPRAVVDDGSTSGDDAAAPAAMIDGPSHHVALLRSPELVVDYLPCSAAPEGSVEWAGVFRCRDEHDQRFARSEPPTHNGWSPKLMEKGPDKTIVNVALRRIQDAADAIWQPEQGESSTSEAGSAVIANRLSHLVGSGVGSGPGRADSTSGNLGSSSTGRSKLEVLRSGPTLRDGSVLTEVVLRVAPKRGVHSVRLHIDCGAAVDGSISKDVDPGIRLIEAVCGPVGTEFATGECTLDLLGDSPSEISVFATSSGDASVLMSFELEDLAS